MADRYPRIRLDADSTRHLEAAMARTGANATDTVRAALAAMAREGGGEVTYLAGGCFPDAICPAGAPHLDACLADARRYMSSAPGGRERERLEELHARITEKVPLLREMALDTTAFTAFGAQERSRREGKAQGVALAASFVEEVIRDLPPAPTPETAP